MDFYYMEVKKNESSRGYHITKYGCACGINVGRNDIESDGVIIQIREEEYNLISACNGDLEHAIFVAKDLISTIETVEIVDSEDI